MDLFKRWNNIVGWVVFAIAALVYLLTIEPSTSLWDCSEFIATSYKLEVGHPPGAPLFMMLARLATLFAPSAHYVPMAVNAMNALASAFCILFLFWTITHLARRIFGRGTTDFSTSQLIAILGAGAVGALSYTFTDTFWFSAVEAEVYALSSMFTALVVWLMLKWEDEADSPHSMRWLILIAYLMGLSIGVHILNLLTIPALVFIYYFRKWDKVSWRGVFFALLISGGILLFINALVIPYTVYIGAMFDTFFVNVLSLPVNSGLLFFVLAVMAALFWGVWYTHRRGAVVANAILLAVSVIMIGYSSYASVSIRASANPPMNSNNPSNPHALFSFLNRDQYGQRPLLYGAYYSAPIEETKSKEFYYLGADGKYQKGSTLVGYTHPDEFMHLFPRMWNYSKGEKEYMPWAAYRTKTDFQRDENGNMVLDAAGRPIRIEVADFGRAKRYDSGYGEPQPIIEPTAAENLNFFFSYQLNYMYWRYFLWNFVGRQNDIQATESTITDGNWMSGVKAIDKLYLGPQDNLPREVAENPARNTYFFLPFILGLIGLLYQLNRDQRNFSVVMLLFVMMGIALVVYFNTSPSEPRERDYVYAGSFYAFSMWIGFGVLALYEFFGWLTKRRGVGVAVAATVVSLVVPTVLAAQNWDDHDRSGRTFARDIGWNYLNSTLPNSIIINYGDNDTFPLWFNQEVDGVRPDVRIMNTSYLGGEWYIDEMKTKANDAEGVPFSLPRSKYYYKNDYIPVMDAVKQTVDIKDVVEFIKSDDKRTQRQLFGDGSYSDFIPTKKIALPVNRRNVLESGTVKAEDAALIVDTVYINITKDYLDKGEMMLLDMLASFDWKRPIYFTQPYILQSLGMLDYLQFDGYAYRLVPIKTPQTRRSEVGRIDPEYASNLLLNVYRYGNLADEGVNADYFVQYNVSASKMREAFARVAREYAIRGDSVMAVKLLDEGLKRLPLSKIRFTDTNTYPFIEVYYSVKAYDKGDALLKAYADSIIEYLDYYVRFDGNMSQIISPMIDLRLAQLDELYYLAGYAGRRDMVRYFNEYYKSIGATDEELMQVD